MIIIVGDNDTSVVIMNKVDNYQNVEKMINEIIQKETRKETDDKVLKEL